MALRESRRRGQILDGAVEVLGEAGLRGFTHRAIDAHAGLPIGTTSAYFRTRQALLTGVAVHVGERMNAEIEELAVRVRSRPGDHEYVAEQVLVMVDGWFEHPGRTAATLEIRLEGRRDPAVREAFGQWQQRWVEIVEGLVAVAGHDEARLRAETIVAGVEGVVMAWLGDDAADRHVHAAGATRLLLSSVLGT